MKACSTDRGQGKGPNWGCQGTLVRPSRWAWRGPRELVGGTSTSPSRRTRALARGPSPTRPCTEAPTIPASARKDSASGSPAPVPSSPGSRLRTCPPRARYRRQAFCYVGSRTDGPGYVCSLPAPPPCGVRSDLKGGLRNAQLPADYLFTMGTSGAFSGGRTVLTGCGMPSILEVPDRLKDAPWWQARLTR